MLTTPQKPQWARLSKLSMPWYLGLPASRHAVSEIKECKMRALVLVISDRSVYHTPWIVTTMSDPLWAHKVNLLCIEAFDQNNHTSTGSWPGPAVLRWWFEFKVGKADYASQTHLYRKHPPDPDLADAGTWTRFLWSSVTTNRHGGPTPGISLCTSR
jgi:hypothetical protein